MEDPEITRIWDTSNVNKKKFLFFVIISPLRQVWLSRQASVEHSAKTWENFPSNCRKAPESATENFDLFLKKIVPDSSSTCINPQYLKSWSPISSSNSALSKYSHSTCYSLWSGTIWQCIFESWLIESRKLISMDWVTWFVRKCWSYKRASPKSRIWRGISTTFFISCWI